MERKVLQTIPEENKIQDSHLLNSKTESLQNSFIAVRDTAYLNLTDDFLQNSGLHLDSDVYQRTSDGNFQVVRTNRYRFLSDTQYLKESSCLGARVLDQQCIKSLVQDLTRQGKIPEYIVFKSDENGQIHVYTNRDIAPQTVLGMFQGLYRPSEMGLNKPWCRVVKGFKGEDVGVIDADNILFSNWTRYLTPRDNTNANCSFSSYNYNIILFCDRFVAAGEELVTKN